MFPGETISTGASRRCNDCGDCPKLEVYSSPGGAGFYVGTYCKCGPYSRETEYLRTREEAEKVLSELSPDPSMNSPEDHPKLRQP